MVAQLRSADPHRVGPYQLLGRLGAGGMGQVFLGKSAGGRLVAVKVIRPDLADDAEFRVRFAREVAAARRVSGLFTALVVDADTEGPVPWLATAYVSGPSLAEAVFRHGPLPPSSVLSLAAGLAEGLVAVHEAGVVHRDLKPSNVLLAEDGPRVIDFGISRAAEASSLTRSGMVLGSPGFMSPEQAEGRDVGKASDVFSLGAVLAFAATGESPFGTGATPALVYRVVHSEPNIDDLPAGIQPLVARCLAKDPDQRPTAQQVVAEVGPVQPSAVWLPAPMIEELSQYAPSALALAEEMAAVGVPAEPVPGTAAAPIAPSPDRSGAPSTLTAAQGRPAGPPGTGAGAAGVHAQAKRRKRRSLIWAAFGLITVLAVVALAVAGSKPSTAQSQSPAGSAQTTTPATPAPSSTSTPPAPSSTPPSAAPVSSLSSQTSPISQSPNSQTSTQTAPANTPPPSTVTTVSVPADQPWADSGNSLNPGDTISITASGTVYIAGSDPGKTPAGAQGCVATADNSIPPGPFLVPGLTCFSLIGRIGNNSAFEIGTGVTFTATNGGELFLSVDDNFFGDNSGAWTVTIESTPAS